MPEMTNCATITAVFSIIFISEIIIIRNFEASALPGHYLQHWRDYYLGLQLSHEDCPRVKIRWICEKFKWIVDAYTAKLNLSILK